MPIERSIHRKKKLLPETVPPPFQLHELLDSFLFCILFEWVFLSLVTQRASTGTGVSTTS